MVESYSGRKVYLPGVFPYAPSVEFPIRLRNWELSWEWAVIHGYSIFDDKVSLMDHFFDEKLYVIDGDEVVFKVAEEDSIPCLELFLKQIEQMLD
jgi:hypothetical protein